MRILAECLLAFFATTGLFFLGWTLFGRLLAPAGQPFLALICVCGGAEELEQQVQQLQWLRGGHLAHCRIILVDTGLNPVGERRVSLLLSREPTLALCVPEQVADQLKKDGSSWTPLSWN